VFVPSIATDYPSSFNAVSCLSRVGDGFCLVDPVLFSLNLND
jgi:hypothetical protein